MNGSTYLKNKRETIFYFVIFMLDAIKKRIKLSTPADGQLHVR